ncbi:unnamed protein product [marine sediment metagenome]|uniref:Uncharacterized protein n=1 Tax=marine sediment metagenome TaxID=412755 RepID=X1L5C1_9ZZZZ
MDVYLDPALAQCKGCGDLVMWSCNWKGYCTDCAIARNVPESVRQMRERRGPIYEKWKEKTIEGLHKHMAKLDKRKRRQLKWPRNVINVLENRLP